MTEELEVSPECDRNPGIVVYEYVPRFGPDLSVYAEQTESREVLPPVLAGADPYKGSVLVMCDTEEVPVDFVANLPWEIQKRECGVSVPEKKSSHAGDEGTWS